MNSARSTRSSRRASKAIQEDIAKATDAIPEELFKEEEEIQEEKTNSADNNDQEMKEEDGNESSSLGSVNDEMEEDEEDQEQEETNMSPSPNKHKDMHLRSGRRKRRRSKETTGLTPPEDVSTRKRSRRGGRSVEKPSENEEEVEESAAEDNADATAPEADDAAAPTQQETIAEESSEPEEQNQEEDHQTEQATRTARDSILLSDNTALAAAHQEPESVVVDPVDTDDGRRLFDAKPPTMPTTTTETSESPSPADSRNETAVNGMAASSSSVAAAPAMESKTAEEGPPEELEIPPPPSQQFSFKQILLLYIVLIVVSFRVWIPLAGKVALAIVPLNQEALQVEPSTTVVEEEPEVVVDNEDSTPAVPSEILKGLAGLESARNSIGSSVEGLEAYKAEIDSLITMIRKHADVNKRKMMIRFSRLMEAEKVLQNTLKENNSSPEAWKDARDAIEALGLPNKKLVDTSLIDLWHVEDPLECPEDASEVDGGSRVAAVVEDKDPPISPRMFENTETNLLLRATMTAEKIVRSDKAEANVRAWVRDKIETAIEDDDDILAALEQIKSMSLDDEDANALSIEMIGALLQERLELEMADGTGAFDHAALMSGAKIIYGGKRGTSKSITDSLPLYNRLMQLARLRFYGYGPEAAITPTYPKNTLGQCWSFQPLTVKEQLKVNQPDDHKHGTFGTLTISFAKPVKIETISIEHPTVTDHPRSAIRGFRIIGYEDALAEGRGQIMGSFQYRIGDSSIQEFRVADKGAMQSLSLAIDSNWGQEYACLYRFRVHGVGVDDD